MKKFIQKKFKKAIISLLILIFFSSSFGLNLTAKAELSLSRTWDSQADFAQGTADVNIEINQAPGDLKLKQNKSTYTETTKADFDAGHSSTKDVMTTQNDDGEVVINQGYSYTAESIPAIAGNNAQHSWKDSATGLLYVSSNYGVSVIDTKNTTTLTDDERLIIYNENSTPALLTNNAQNPDYYKSFIDPNTGYLYIVKGWSVSNVLNGLQVIDTKSTKTPSDDTFVTSYTKTGSIARLPDEDVITCEMDYENGLIYCIGNDANSGIAVIDTKKTNDPSDDTSSRYTTTGVYNTTNGVNTLISATPKLGSSGSRQNSLSLDRENNIVYLLGATGIVVVNTQGTINPSDDTSYNYTPTGIFNTTNNSAGTLISSLAVPSYCYSLDKSGNLLYISTWYNGLSVINTQGTADPADDTLVKTYTTTTTPNLANNNIHHSFLDTTNNLLYASTYSGLSVINTQGTIDPADDTLVKTYTTTTTPNLANNNIRHSFLDTTNNLLYASTDGGLSVINLNEKYNPQGEIISQPLSLVSIPANTITFSPTIPDGTNASIQTRTGSSDAVWENNFDNNNSSEYVGDFYDWGAPFQTAVEDNGTMKLSNPSPDIFEDNQWVDTWLDLGQTFPIGSRVTTRYRVNSQREKAGYADYVFNAGWYDDDGGNWQNNEWINATFVADYTEFSKIGFDINWKTGTWNNANDSLEIDYIKIEVPNNSAWDPWSELCTNQYGCSIGDTTDKAYIQYKLNLATTNTEVTPQINSVTISSGYADSATYTSQIVDATRTAHWQNLSANAITPTGTSITYATRSGVTPIPDSSWSAWQQTTSEVTNSPDARYFQYQITLTTTDVNQTPIVSALMLSYTLLEARTVIDPTPQDIVSEMQAGFISNAGTDPAATPDFTFNVDFTLQTGTSTIYFPTNTQVTRTGGGDLDLTQLTISNNTALIQAQIKYVLGAIKIGIPNFNLTFSQPITVTIPVGDQYNEQTLQVVSQREGESDWNDEITCQVTNGNCVFQTNHATSFAAQQISEEEEENQKADIDSWKAFPYDKPDLKCVQRLKVKLKGKHFANNAEVKIGNNTAFAVERKSSKEITAKFCLEKLLDIKTDLKRVVSVTNPDADRKKADKKINLEKIILPRVSIMPVISGIASKQITVMPDQVTAVQQPIPIQPLEQNAPAPSNVKIEDSNQNVQPQPQTFIWWNPATWF